MFGILLVLLALGGAKFVTDRLKAARLQRIHVVSAADISEAPGEVQTLSDDFAGIEPDAIRHAIIAKFGDADRDIGSGLLIEQWDVYGGILTFHPLNGPTFTTDRGQLIRLIPTHNPVGENLYGSFELTTLPDPANHGTRFWIGNVKISRDGKYQFKPGGFEAEDIGAEDVFFVLHPQGSVDVTLAPSVTEATLLEDVSSGSTLARLKFHSTDGSATLECDVRSDPLRRSLDFHADPPRDFQAGDGWENHFK